MNLEQYYNNNMIITSDFLDGIFNEDINKLIDDYLCNQKTDKYNQQIQKLIFEENERLRIIEQNKILTTNFLIQDRNKNIFELNNIIPHLFLNNLILNEIKNAIKDYCELKEKKIFLNTNTYIELVNFLNSCKHQLNKEYIKNIFEIIEEKYNFDTDDDYIYNDE